MEGIRLNKYGAELKNIEMQIATLSDIQQVAVLHEIIDDTPFKTQSYNKYQHDEYYIFHNKPVLLRGDRK